MTSPDPLASLAVTLESSPGRYALLVGSGISASAGVPTGWAVVEDVALKLAVAAGESTDLDDPIGWYRKTHGSDPDYSSLLGAVAPTAAARQELLSSYFARGDDADDEIGNKDPSPAHRAIADLVARGLARVIVTTNFDRLLERALQEIGVDPVVVASDDAAAGTTPLAHSPCTLIKVHGDYLDPNIKNTVGELSAYGVAMDALLDRVMDDYGLIVCGWSGDWDPALRAAIERCPSRRYGTYWAARGDLSSEAERLVAHRGAVVIPIDGADEFFQQVANTTSALAELRSRPTGVLAVASQVKKWLPDPVHRIRLDDIMTDSVAASLASVPDAFPTDPTHAVYLADAHAIESASVDLMVAMALCGAWAERPDHDELLQRAFTRLSGATGGIHSGVTAWVELRHYPTLLAAYAAGIGAVHAKNWNAISRVLATGGTTATGAERNASIAVMALSWTALSHDSIEAHNGRKLKTPVSTYIYELMAETLADVLRIAPDRFENIFDEWEFLLHVTARDQYGRSPFGRWVWRQHWWSADAVPRNALDLARASLASVGFFDESNASDDESRFDEVLREHLERVQNSGVRFS